ncbi:L-aspartate oxidase [Parvibaculum sp.]|uniref:L-aspartate oxidase n=1 Tax=Parvibaculum sp. TaxID=2024848 RepID=UPI000C6A374A|nr:L-aspartate oxidase [Parvibaculum sp.]MAU62099.1 L-aspartate oxidase [Parvibaculum sp.]MBO6666991.1 L-aspartate oxidase [Parvibaculum sp.]MBO6690435.1 L-aspartate oxidase [Parvibaculum sp.]MBO6713612.1 L-aspartate oxidase [Parvibaculum sp.]|tara:strand:- start:15282 stop:16895 length:1614 start_codon:yes stop_codon:yes gene_type:complete
MAQGNIVDAGDVLIVGAGLAGLFTALKLSPRPVTVLAGAPIGDGASSAWAQGGIAAAIEPGDTAESHAADTIAAGAGTVDEEAALSIAREAATRIEDLLRLGVPFDRDIEGKLAVGREAAHSHRRIVHVKGDQAGKAIMQALVAAVRACPSIRVMEGLSAYELAIENGRAAGVFARPAHAATAPQPLLIKARAVVLASGGVGQLFAVTTNPTQARGEGVAMAARAGAIIADPEFVQFHPTAIASTRDPAPLVTEALRGEGAILVNKAGQRFMTAIHEDAELGPRDIVARAIFREIASGRGAFLDARAALGTRFADAFPTVYENCRSLGIDPAREPIPVAPAAHYHMGGILVDARGRSTVEGLWACGEVASTGMHGANRLASNSLLEAIVFGARIAADIDGSVPEGRAGHDIAPPVIGSASSPDTPFVDQLRKIMASHVGVERDGSGLAHALTEIARLERAAGPASLFRNIATTAKLIAASAYAREESRGGHYRTDFTEPRAPWRHRTFVTLKEANRIAEAAIAALPAAQKEETQVSA